MHNGHLGEGTDIVILIRKRADTVGVLVYVIDEAAAHKESAEWANHHSF